MNKPVIIGGIVLAVLLAAGAAMASPPDKPDDPPPDKPDDPPPAKPDDPPVPPFKGGGIKPPDVEPVPAPFVVDLDAEADGCAWAAANKPIEFNGRKPEGQTLEQWLALVAFMRAYPNAPLPPTSDAQLAALGRMLQCIKAKLGADKPINAPPALPVPVSPPTPGSYYQIVYGDTLLGVAGQAYKLGAGQARLAAAQHINAAPYNLRFHDFPDNLFPPSKMRISFNPRYGSPAAQFADAVNGADGGNKFAVIFIPE